MEDSRAIGKELLSKYRDENGVFYPFHQFVKNHQHQLAVCFRGNGTPAKISIYYNNHIVWNLYEEGGEEKISISFNHARYCKDWEEKLEALGKLGFRICDSKGNRLSPEKSDSIGYLVCKCSSKEYEKDGIGFVIKSYDIIMSCMNKFFKPKEKEDMDYFKGKKIARMEYYTEKRWQQWLFNTLKYTNNGLFAYDLEFSQPGGTQEKETNEPDMLALRYENGKPKAIVLVEVKSLSSACEPKKNKKGRRGSDIYEHLRSMKKYASSDHIISRRKEVHDILNAYKELGIYVKKEQIIPEKDNTLPVECMLIMTTADLIDCGQNRKSGDSAIHYYLTHKKELENAVKENGKYWCEIQLVGQYSKNKVHGAAIYNLPEEWN